MEETRHIAVLAGGKKKAAPKEKKERKKKGSAESNTGFSMKPFAEIKRIAQYTKEADFDKEKIEQYKNSIAEHGYDPAFPMVIDKDKKTGAYNVVAGNHRYKAVEALISEGKLPKDLGDFIRGRKYSIFCNFFVRCNYIKLSYGN